MDVTAALWSLSTALKTHVEKMFLRVRKKAVRIKLSTLLLTSYIISNT